MNRPAVSGTLSDIIPYVRLKNRSGLERLIDQTGALIEDRPAPMALWPTSLFPISSSEGSPTAVPWAFNVVNNGDLSN